MQYFPLFMDLKDKPVLVVGGGEVASRKVDTLIRAGADVTIVSPCLSDFLNQLVEDAKCRWISSAYKSTFMTQFVQVWATTNNSDLNHKVYQDAKDRNILVNVVDDKPFCDFITPSLVNRGRIQLAISSGGASPVLVRKIREQLEITLPQNISLLADFAQNKRDEVKKNYSTVEKRRAFWERFFSFPDINTLKDEAALTELYDACNNSLSNVTVSLNFIEYSNDVELLSIKALREMQRSECVYFSSDCPFGFVDLCRRDAERIEYKDVGDLLHKLSSQEESVENIKCIFIQKDTWAEQPKLENLVASGQLFRIVG